MDAIAELDGLDRHELVHQLLYKHILTTIHGDKINLIPDKEMLTQLSQSFITL
jgi:hypothetical protein